MSDRVPWGVVGPNGAGKGTLFDAVAGILSIAQGKVELYGAGARKGALACVPQRDSIDWRFPAMVFDVVMVSQYCHVQLFRNPGKYDRDMARECLERKGLWDRRSSMMNELSGGQRQRVL